VRYGHTQVVLKHLTSESALKWWKALGMRSDPDIHQDGIGLVSAGYYT
jgi:hypothetical protein